MEINWIDVLLVLIVLFGAFGGWLRGFVLSSIDLVRWTAGLAAGFAFYAAASSRLESLTGWSAAWSRPATFLLIVAATSLIVDLLAKLLIKRLQPDFHKQQINRVFGVLPGGLNGLIAAAIAASLLLVAPFDNRVVKAADKSDLAKSFAAVVQSAEPYFESVFGAAVAEIFKRQSQPLPTDSNGVELPFKVENAPALPQIEAQMLELVNRERAAHNLRPLAGDSELTAVARKHSLDMFARGYFAHNTPENLSPFDRMKRDGVRFLTAGENLALAPNVIAAHTGLMNSPGHRANILKPQFGRVGIGIVDGGRRGLMVTQNFRN